MLIVQSLDVLLVVRMSDSEQREASHVRLSFGCLAIIKHALMAKDACCETIAMLSTYVTQITVKQIVLWLSFHSYLDLS